MRTMGSALAVAVLAASTVPLAGAQTSAGPFPDVPHGHWAYQAVESLRTRGILLGYPDRSAKKSGAEGMAEVGPVRPVEREGEPNVRPLAGAVITFQAKDDGHELARVKANGAGRFRVELPPGTYRLVPLAPRPGSRYPRGAPQDIVVRKGRFTHVRVEYDSGIR